MSLKLAEVNSLPLKGNALMEFRKRARLSPIELYSPERIVQLGEVDLTKPPQKWVGWDEESIGGNTAIIGSLGTYKGRIIYWSEGAPTYRRYFSVIRWDSKTSTHFFVGNYTNGFNALNALGVVRNFKWAPLGGNKFLLKSY